MFASSKASNSNLSNDCSSPSINLEEEIEPYVRRKRADGPNRKKMQGLNEQEQNLLRNSINSRERRRMHELNEEFEALRECLPYSNDSNSRRTSKATTLLLATNWIEQLTKANHVLQAELNAAKAQIAVLLKTQISPDNTSTLQNTDPATTSSKSSSSKCSNCQKAPCFSMSCITSS